MKSLTEKQKTRLKEHAKHYSKKHMTQMKKDMRKGISFTRAHLLAKKM